MWTGGSVLKFQFPFNFSFSLVLPPVREGRSLYYWWELIWSKQLSGVCVCRVLVFGHNNSIYNITALLTNMEKEMSLRDCYFRLESSVSGDTVANTNVYQLLIFMVRIESRRSERWLQPIYSGSVISFGFILNCVGDNILFLGFVYVFTTEK